jgi:hypothetical protein
MTFNKSKVFLILGILSVVTLFWFQQNTTGQSNQTQGSRRSSVLSTGGGESLIDPSDTVVVLLDHQAGRSCR